MCQDYNNGIWKILDIYLVIACVNDAAVFKKNNLDHVVSQLLCEHNKNKYGVSTISQH